MSNKTPKWDGAVAEFLSNNLPTTPDRPGWAHNASTSYQIGCMALIALGYAEERIWGAVPRDIRKTPDVFPRWDDICIAVIWLADQKNLLGFRLPDGGIPPTRFGTGFVIKQIGAPAPPAPNIAASHGLGPAFAKPSVISLLEQLGVVADGCWIAEAEMILWRTSPGNWSLDFMSDPRFWMSVEHAVKTLPGDVEDQLRGLLVIDDGHVDEHIARRVEALEELRAKHGAGAVVPDAPTREQARKSIESHRWDAMDWIFFRHWRMDEGWLSEAEQPAALEIFHDRLAIAVRKAVVDRLSQTQSDK